MLLAHKEKGFTSPKTIFLLGLTFMALGITNAVCQHKWWLIPQAVIIFTMPYMPQLFGSAYQTFMTVRGIRQRLRSFVPLSLEFHGAYDAPLPEQVARNGKFVFYSEETTTLARVSVYDGVYESISFTNLGTCDDLTEYGKDTVRLSLKATPFLVQLYFRDVINYFLSPKHEFPENITTSEFMDELTHRARRIHKVNSVLS